MTRTLFELDLGTKQGRIPNVRSPGAFVVELGHADRIIGDFEEGSYHAISQQVTLTPGKKLLRMNVTIVAPTLEPEDNGSYEGNWVTGTWLFTAEMNSIVFYSRPIRPDGRVLTLSDIAVSVVGADGADLVLRLGAHWASLGG